MRDKISDFISDIRKQVLCLGIETLETVHNFYYIINSLAFWIFTNVQELRFLHYQGMLWTGPYLTEQSSITVLVATEW
jgi:hypothetical protein